MGKQNKLALLLLSAAILLAQFCETKQDSSSSSESSSSSDSSEEHKGRKYQIKYQKRGIYLNEASFEDDVNLSERERLLDYTLKKIGKLSYDTLDDAEDICKDVRDAIYKRKLQSEPFQFLLNTLKDYIAKIKRLHRATDIEGVKQLINALIEFNQIVTEYTSQAQPSAAYQYIVMLFKRYGLVRFETEFSEHFLKFNLKFEARIEHYIQTLDKLQQINESNLLSWYDDFKQEKELNEKLARFISFFKLYEENVKNVEEKTEGTEIYEYKVINT